MPTLLSPEELFQKLETRQRRTKYSIKGLSHAGLKIWNSVFYEKTAWNWQFVCISPNGLNFVQKNSKGFKTRRDAAADMLDNIASSEKSNPLLKNFPLPEKTVFQAEEVYFYIPGAQFYIERDTNERNWFVTTEHMGMFPEEFYTIEGEIFVTRREAVENAYALAADLGCLDLIGAIEE